MSSIVITGSINSNWHAVHDLLTASPDVESMPWPSPQASEMAGESVSSAVEAISAGDSQQLRCLGAGQLVMQLDQIHKIPKGAFFVIACSSPEQALSGRLYEHERAVEVQTQTTGEVLNTWKSQVRRILNFTYRFRERCLIADAKACLDEPQRLQQALSQRFGVHVKLAAAVSPIPATFPCLSSLIASSLVDDELGVDELYDEVEGACDLLPANLSVGAGLGERRQRALAGSVGEYPDLLRLASRLEDTEAELQMAAIHIVDLQRELEERYQDIDDYGTRLTTMMNFAGKPPTLSLLRRRRTPQST